MPVALDQNDYEQVYSDAWWYKLKHGTAVKGVFWNGAKDGGLGDIDLRLVDLLNLYWEPGITYRRAGTCSMWSWWTTR